MKKTVSILLSITIIASLILSFSGCGTPPTQTIKAKNLMADIKPNKISYTTDFAESYIWFSDFSAEMFKRSNMNGKNVLISPLSIISALAMTVNGAENDTLKELEAVLGCTKDELNNYMARYIDCITKNKSDTLKLANSIWFAERQDFAVNRDFLQTNADYNKAEIYSAPFNKSTVDEINKWVKKNTDGMIPKIIDELNSESLMCLINALCFEADWEEPYEDIQVQKGTFYSADGKHQNVEFMHSSEDTYLKDDTATGFIKYYKDRKYAFVAILPNEDIKLEDYIDSLTGEKISKLLYSAENTEVYTKMPKFEYDYGTELSDTLKAMGIESAFSLNNADFSGIGTVEDGNIYIDRVIHKTYIQVAEQGTRAGAATAAVMKAGSAANPERPPEVYLDRPFMYMIIDCENSMPPLFIGTVNQF